MTTEPILFSKNCRTIPVLSGFGVIKKTGFIILNDKEEYFRHEIQQDPPNAGYTVALRLINGETNSIDKEINSENFKAHAQLQVGVRAANLNLGVEKSTETSQSSSISIQTKSRIVEITVTGGKSSCCGIGKESSFKVCVFITQTITP